MKNIFYLLIIMSVVSCSIDNYDGPSLTLSGKVIDNENNDMIENGGINGGTRIFLFEGTSKQPIISNSHPDGSFMNNALFPGDYRLVVEGPFKMAEDTIRFSLTKHTELDVKVLPNVRMKATLQSFDGTTATVKVEYNKVHADQTLNLLGVVWSTLDNPNAFTYSGGGQKAETVTGHNLTSGEMIFTITGLKTGNNYFIRATGRTDAPGAYYNYSTTINTK